MSFWDLKVCKRSLRGFLELFLVLKVCYEALKVCDDIMFIVLRLLCCLQWMFSSIDVLISGCCRQWMLLSMNVSINECYCQWMLLSIITL
jgi:hypothetical protein